MPEFSKSGRNNPCPVCGRTKDQDCRVKEQENVVFCHSYVNDPGELVNGYKHVGSSSDDLWGIFVWDEVNKYGKVSGKKVRTGSHRKEYFYPTRNGDRFVKVQKVATGDSKKFYQFHWDGNDWVAGMPYEIKADIPIYRYQDVRDAIASGQPIVIVEGESTANSLWDLGIAATTTIGGSKKYRSYGKNYKSDLEGASIILAPDRDKAGVAHMEEVAKDFSDAQWLRAYPKSPVWSCLPDDGGLDLDDWIKDGATLEMVMGAIDQREHKKPPQDNASSKPKPTYQGLCEDIEKVIASTTDLAERHYRFGELARKHYQSMKVVNMAIASVKARRNPGLKDSYSLLELMQLHNKSSNWILPSILPVGDITIFTGESGMGKSLHAYEAAFQVVSGGKFMDSFVPKGKVLFAQTDEGMGSTIGRMVNRGFTEYTENIRVMPKFDLAKLDKLEQLLIDFQPSLVVVDTLRNALKGCGIDENTAEAGNPIADLKELLAEYNCSAILIHYLNKKKDAEGLNRVAGNQAIPAQAFSVFEISKSDGYGAKTFTAKCLKNRDGQKVTFQSYIDDQTDGWALKYQAELQTETAQLDISDRILQLLKVNREQGIVLLRGQEICSLLGVTPDRKGTVYNALKRLIAKNAVERDQVDTYRNRPVYGYAINTRVFLDIGGSAVFEKSGQNAGFSLSQNAETTAQKGFTNGHTNGHLNAHTPIVNGHIDSHTYESMGIHSVTVLNNSVTKGVTKEKPLESNGSSLNTHADLSDQKNNKNAYIEEISSDTSIDFANDKDRKSSIHKTKPLEPIRDQHPQGKRGKIDYTEQDSFTDRNGLTLNRGDPVDWPDCPEKYKAVEFQVERIYAQTALITLYPHPIPHGQLLKPKPT